MVFKVIISELMGVADVVLFAIGLLIMNLPKLIFYNEVRRTLKSEFLQDLTQQYELKFSKNTFVIITSDQEFESAYTDVDCLYETEHFYVIAINEIRHFPMLKSMFNRGESEELKTLFS